MSKRIFLFTCALLLSLFSFSQSEVSTINKLMDDWHVAATTGDFDLYFGLLDTSARFLGTDATENWAKDHFASFSRPYFDRGKAWEFEAVERNIYLTNDNEIAWFDEVLNTWMGLCRGSGLLTKTDTAEWKLQHYVLSVLIPNDDIQEVIKVKNSFDSIYLKERNLSPIGRN